MRVLCLSVMLSFSLPAGAAIAQTVTLPRLAYPEPDAPVDCRKVPTDPACSNPGA